MNVYVIGAGVSMQVGYPVGGQLFSEVDKFVKSPDGSEHREKWDKLCGWLECNEDVLLREAYQNKDLEGMFTILDLASKLRLDASSMVVREMFKRGNTEVERARAGAAKLYGETEFHSDCRKTMLFALGDFFQAKHRDDLNNHSAEGWDCLREFGDKLRRGDVVITFNYDATLERVLLEQRKWTPTDGYGFSNIINFDSEDDRARAELGSAVKILHLHGCVGWFDWGTSSPSAAPANLPRSTIALSRSFLQSLGANVRGTSILDPPEGKPMLIHPSFMKNFEQAHGGLPDLWRHAGSALKDACAVFVIGYSLPEADGAAMALLITNTDRKRVQVVNEDAIHSGRLRQLLTSERATAIADTAPPLKFEDWVAQLRSPTW